MRKWIRQSKACQRKRTRRRSEVCGGSRRRESRYVREVMRRIAVSEVRVVGVM